MSPVRIHTEKHDRAGQVVQVTLKTPIIAGVDAGLKVMTFQIEDWWDHLTGASWMDSDGNLAALSYAMRSAASLPIDNNVIYGHNADSGIGHLIHASELEPS